MLYCRRRSGGGGDDVLLDLTICPAEDILYFKFFCNEEDAATLCSTCYWASERPQVQSDSPEDAPHGVLRARCTTASRLGASRGRVSFPVGWLCVFS